MKKLLTIVGIVGGVLVLVVAGVWFAIYRTIQGDPFTPLYAENCAVCHGEEMHGTAQGPALLGRVLNSGESVEEIATSIGAGFPERGMPGWYGALDEGQVRSLAIMIAERRVDRRFSDFKTDKVIELPVDPIDTELARFCRPSTTPRYRTWGRAVGCRSTRKATCSSPSASRVWATTWVFRICPRPTERSIGSTTTAGSPPTIRSSVGRVPCPSDHRPEPR